MFEKKAILRFRRVVWRELVRLGFQPQTALREMNAGMVLIAVAHFGTDLTALSDITGLSHEFIGRVLKRLRQQRVLRGQKMRITNWDKEGIEGVVGLGLDVMTACRDVKRVPDPKRSAGQKARAPETYARGEKLSRTRPRIKPAAGGVFTPATKNVDSWFTLDRSE